jgi:hypothetical protein
MYFEFGDEIWKLAFGEEKGVGSEPQQRWRHRVWLSRGSCADSRLYLGSTPEFSEVNPGTLPKG